MIPTLTIFAILLAMLLAAMLSFVIRDIRMRHRRIRVRLDDRGGFFG